MDKAWILKSVVCKECDSEIVVSVITDGDGDYQYYCANPFCKNHKGESLADSDMPDWAKDKK
jgi:hypothetical protein